MKKLIPYIISILILIGGYFYFKNELEKDKASFEDEISKIESKYKVKTDSAYAIIDSVTALKNKSIVIAKEAVKAKEIAKSEARTYKNEYNKLVNEIPANQKDSLGNYINRDKVNKKIIAKQDEAIKQCDSAVTAYVKVIDRQNVIDENKDNIIANNEKAFAELKLTSLDYGKEQLNKGRKQGGLVGFISGVGLALLILL